MSSSPPMSIHPSVRLCRICDVFPDNWNDFVTWECYASPVSIQFESHTVELWAIYTMEYDTQVLEFFDQPHQLELHYQGPSGLRVDRLVWGPHPYSGRQRRDAVNRPGA